ncbi:hypothetical protein ABG768_017121, partial [Culter alburnus]
GHNGPNQTTQSCPTTRQALTAVSHSAEREMALDASLTTLSIQSSDVDEICFLC